jgi:hypothetical protein
MYDPFDYITMELKGIRQIYDIVHDKVDVVKNIDDAIVCVQKAKEKSKFIPTVQLPTPHNKHQEEQELDEFTCTKCVNNETTNWSLQDYVERGWPVCPTCGEEMDQVKTT